MTRLILVRHGQTDWNREDRFRGRFDIPLNEHGLHQAQLTSERITASYQPKVVMSSPLLRTTQTASFVSSRLEIPLIKDDGLVDIDYGEWQGLTKKEAQAGWPHLVKDWFCDPTHVRCPNGESLVQVRRRSYRSIKNLCSQFPNDTVLAVSHLVVIRLILLSVLEMPSKLFWHIEQDPCAINQIEWHDQRFILVTMNDTCHLK